MKKLAIAGASVALAAMPVVGTFAATSTQFQDTLTVGVQGGCTIEESGTGTTAGTYKDRAFEATIPVGTSKELTAKADSPYSGEFAVSCNTTTGSWTVSVAASDNGNLKSGSDTIAPLAADKTMGGATSSWAIKSNASGGTTTSNAYSDYKGFVAGDFIKASADQTITFNPSYKAYVATGQNPGNYSGTVTYTIAIDTVQP